MIYKGVAYTVSFRSLNSDGTPNTATPPALSVFADNGTANAATNAPTHVAGGAWRVTLTAAEMTGNLVTLIHTGAGLVTGVERIATAQDWTTAKTGFVDASIAARPTMAQFLAYDLNENGYGDPFLYPANIGQAIAYAWYYAIRSFQMLGPNTLGNIGGDTIFATLNYLARNGAARPASFPAPAGGVGFDPATDTLEKLGDGQTAINALLTPEIADILTNTNNLLTQVGNVFDKVDTEVEAIRAIVVDKLATMLQIVGGGPAYQFTGQALNLAPAGGGGGGGGDVVRFVSAPRGLTHLTRRMLKAGDLSPDRRVLLGEQDADGQFIPHDLTGATGVRYVLRERGSLAAEPPTVDAAATIISAAGGVAEYIWQAGDTDNPGKYEERWVVTLANGDKQSYPEEGYALLVIEV